MPLNRKVVAATCSPHGWVYSFCGDGAVFVLIPRGTVDAFAPAGQDPVVKEPKWVMCPPIPGTPAATDQEG